jgi:hypothetical protein
MTPAPTLWCLLALAPAQPIGEAVPASEPTPAVAGQPPVRVEPPPATAEQLRTRPIVLELRELPTDELRDAIGLRLPLRPLVAADDPRPQRYDYVAIEQIDPEHIALTLITAEGHAYDRTLEVDPAARARAISSALANLTFAIEVGDVEPDRIDVEPPPPPVSERAPKLEPPPVLPPPVVVVEPPPPSRPKATPPPTHELGMTIDLGVVAGLAPDTGADALAAGYGRLGADLRHRSGALGMLGVRVGGRALDGFSLVRTRIDLGGGWSGRWSAFELVLAAAATVEPWSLRRAGARAPLQLGGDDAQRRPLLGGLLRVSPGLRLRAGDKAWIRLGTRIELAGSFVPQRGVHTIDIAIAEPGGTRDSILRIGGLELVAGVELAVWFALR